MAIYTYESRSTPARISRALLVPDTSYLISLSLPDSHTPIIQNFHPVAIRSSAAFCINSIVRLELLEKIRYGSLFQLFSTRAVADPAVESLYRSLRQLSNRSDPDLRRFISVNADKLFKYHVRQGDFDTLWVTAAFDIAGEEKALEDAAGMNYLDPVYLYQTAQEEADSWLEIGKSLARSGMSSRDSGIVEFALRIGADAILTTDADYAAASTEIDVYLPQALALTCQGTYDAAHD